ncbi:unnamed protein product [Sphagnum tenellum]
MCSQFLIARLRVVKGVLNLETICDCGSHGSSGEWWNANVEQVVIDVLATAVPTGFQMHLRSMATLATCTTSSAGHQPAVYMVGVLGFHVSQERLRECTDAYKVKAKPGYKFYMTATPFLMVPYDAMPGDLSSWAKKGIANLPP